MFFPLEIILFLITKLGVIKLGLNSAYFKKENIDHELIDLVTKPVLRRTSARSLRAMCIGMSSRDDKFQASYLLRKLSASKKVPFLLIWGEKDNFIPLFVGKKIANFHRWVKLIIVSNSGHCVHDEDPSVFNKISHEWIRDLKTNFNEIKDKSATTKFGNSLLLDKRSLGFKFLILVRSKSITFGLVLIFNAVCP